MDRNAKWIAASLFVMLIGGTSLFLWHAHAMTLAQQLASTGMIVAGLSLVGTISTPRRPSRTPTETSAAALAARPGPRT